MTGLKACGNITTRQDAGIRAQCITLYARTLTKGFPATQLSPMEPCRQKNHSWAWRLVESLWERNHMSQALELKCIITPYTRSLAHGFPASRLSPTEPCRQKKHSRARRLVESLWERNHMSQALELKCIITLYTRSLAHGFPASRLSPTEPCRQKKHSRARRLVESLWERNHMSQALELKCIITPYTRSLAHGFPASQRNHAIRKTLGLQWEPAADNQTH